MSFTNMYYKRTAGTPKPCFICYKPTTTVLATINTVDFLYTCETHLKDPGFAQLSATPAVSAEDVGKAVADWEERQKLKKEKADEKDKDKKEDDKKDDGDSKKKKEENKSASPPSKPATPTHEKYVLHRDIFSIRLSEHRKKRQTAAAKDLAPRFPGAPRGTL